MAKIITDFETWLIDETDTRIFRYLVYKKVYTPREQHERYVDESEYENGGMYTLAKIEEALDMGNGDWMLGMREIFDDGSIAKHLKYVRLSEIRLSSFDEDQEIEIWDDIDELEEDSK